MTDTALLQISDLSVAFTNIAGSQTVVNRVNFELYAGETLALVGESGSGKSVTALSILQLLPYPRANHPGGSILFKGEELVAAPESRLQRIRGDRIGMIFQEPMTSLNPLHTIEKQINEVLLLHKGLSPVQARERTMELLELVGLEKFKDRLNAYPHQLSGGERQRVMIAMALANEPDILIADEPTTALDVTIQAQILDLLREIQSKLNLSILLITHDLTVVQSVAHRVCVMHQGQIVEQGNTHEIFESPTNTHTRELIAAEPDDAPVAEKPDAPEVLSVDNIRVWFPLRRGLLRRTVDHVRAVDGISLKIHESQTLGLVGESGSGKTTLGLAILNLIPYQGSVVFMGQSIERYQHRQMRSLRQHMQIVFQDPYASLSPRMSIGQIILEGLVAHKLGGSKALNDEKVIAALESVELDSETRFRYPHEFSGGQRQRIAIARAMILTPRLIVLDEPTSALDRAVQVQMISLLKKLQRKHKLAYLFISHDLRVVRSMANQILVMQEGKLVEQGSNNDIFNNPRQAYTRQLIKASLSSALKLP
ncbi:MAG: ABC transporter ATP-binding protein [Gammaproteobacteria bacterium]|nr:ABC transporter ATP-binding protein [Gammaproteobacteria bacterium]